MNKSKYLSGAFIGSMTSLPVMAILYLGNQLMMLPFVPFDAFDWLARVLPGDIITIGIDGIVSLITAFNLGDTSQTAKAIEQFMAIVLFILFGAVLGILIAWGIKRWPDSRQWVGSIVGFLALFLVWIVELGLGSLAQPIVDLLWLALVFAGWGWIMGKVLLDIETALTEETPADLPQTSRREALIRLVAASAGVAIGAFGLGRLLGPSRQVTGASRPLEELAPTANAPSTIQPSPTPLAPSTPLQQTAVAVTRDQISPAPGTRPELTSNDEFYRIDINTRPPTIGEDEWQLEVTGLFERSANLSLNDLMEYPAITQPITLSCISNRVGGDLIGTSNWTGLRLRDLMEDLGLQPEARSLVVEAEDGFHETVIMEDILDPRTLLVYGMNGQTLPVDHGFPLRIYIPDRYGMKQPKWITRITAVDSQPDGYWVRRGWSLEARPQIVSVIDTVATDEPTADGLIPIGGIAWAGERGISKVELQFNDGDWLEATLRTPPLSPLTWFQWRYDWEATPGSYDIRVRATDGTGQLQIEEVTPVRPDGATGYHSTSVRI